MSGLSGKHGLIVGVANKRSISWAIAQAAAAAGARIAMTYPSERLAENVRQHSHADLLQVCRDRAPLKRNVDLAEVADTATFLLSTVNCVVTISGTVRSKAEESRAIELARQVAGVKDVRSTLQASGGATTLRF